MRPLLVYPDPVPSEVAQSIEFAGHSWVAATSASALPDVVAGLGDGAAIAGAVVIADRSPAGAWAVCEALRSAEPAVPILLIVGALQLGELESREPLYDDFCIAPFEQREFARRLTRMLWQAAAASRNADLVVYQALSLNVDTYEATISGRELDLTHMEYELLRHLATSPGRVFSREVLLSQVWGYDYFGGARTVDVHIRRLRAKLGPEGDGLIQTVRSVGYTLK